MSEDTTGNPPEPRMIYCHRCTALSNFQMNAQGLLECSTCQGGFVELLNRPEQEDDGSEQRDIVPSSASEQLDVAQAESAEAAASLSSDLVSVIVQFYDMFSNNGSSTPARPDLSLLTDYSITQADVDNHKNCPICMEEFDLDEVTRRLPCTHYFHERCIMQWLSQRSTCPVCRHPLHPTRSPEQRTRRSVSASDSTLTHVHIGRSGDARSSSQQEAAPARLPPPPPQTAPVFNPVSIIQIPAPAIENAVPLPAPHNLPVGYSFLIQPPVLPPFPQFIPVVLQQVNPFPLLQPLPDNLIPYVNAISQLRQRYMIPQNAMPVQPVGETQQSIRSTVPPAVRPQTPAAATVTQVHQSNPLGYGNPISYPQRFLINNGRRTIGMYPPPQILASGDVRAFLMWPSPVRQTIPVGPTLPPAANIHVGTPNPQNLPPDDGRGSPEDAPPAPNPSQRDQDQVD